MTSFFVCGYILDASKDLTKSYSCNEGDLLSPDEVNTAPLKSFLTIPDGKSKINDVKINVLVPYYDKLEGVKMKVVAMVKGEFQSKVIVIDRKQATASLFDMAYIFKVRLLSQSNKTYPINQKIYE